MLKIKDLPTLGERIKKRREELGLSVEEVAEEIQTTPAYVRAIEADRYDTFSAKVYALGFFRKLAAALAIDDQNALAQEFSNEWEIRMLRYTRPIPLPKNTGSPPLITPVRLGWGIGGVVLLFFFGFFAIRLTAFLQLPKLVIETPDNQTVFFSPVVHIKGRAEKEGRLTVNGREVRIDKEGFFDEELEFSAGMHALEFFSQSRFGKETKVTRYIVVK